MRSTLLVGIVLLIGVATALFNIEHNAQFLREQLQETQRQIVENKMEIHTLKAEWAYLSHPQRIRDMAQRYLDVGRIEAKHVARVESIAIRKQVVAVNEAQARY